MSTHGAGPMADCRTTIQTKSGPLHRVGSIVDENDENNDSKHTTMVPLLASWAISETNGRGFVWGLRAKLG